jgi:hypothetical protein
LARKLLDRSFALWVQILEQFAQLALQALKPLYLLNNAFRLQAFLIVNRDDDALDATDLSLMLSKNVG